MPHIVVEYSANLEDHIDIAVVLESLHSAAASHSSVPLAGLRTRAMKREPVSYTHLTLPTNREV